MKIRGKITIKEKQHIQETVLWCISVMREKEIYNIDLINYVDSLAKDSEIRKLIYAIPSMVVELKELSVDRSEIMAIEKLETILAKFTDLCFINWKA